MSVEVISGPPRTGGPPTVATIGVFDGVHLGHRHLLRLARGHADRLGVPLTVLTFDPHPMTVVRPDAAPAMLSRLAHRIELLAGAGADRVRVATFDRALSLLPARAFVDAYLLADVRAVAVVTGANFRFGHRAAGDVALLRAVGAEAGFDVDGVRLHGDVADAWSSTRIRTLVAAGRVAEAAVGLSRWHRVEGTVVHGDHRGRDLGYPTANVALTGNQARPADGVYAGHLVLDPHGPARRALPAAISVGANATFDGAEHRVEAFVLDGLDWDFYGADVAVEFVAHLRDMARFDSVDALLAAMADDVARAARITGTR